MMRLRILSNFDLNRLFLESLMPKPSIHHALILAAATALAACGGHSASPGADGSPPPQGTAGKSQTITGRPLVVVGVDREFPPYSFVDSQGRIAGFTVDLTRAIADVMTFDIELRAGTYEEIIEALERGEVDVIPHLSASEELEKRFAFTLPHLEVSDAIFVRADGTGVSTEGHLRDRQTLVWQAGAVERQLQENRIVGNILPEASLPETMRRLAAGEGDCALVPHFTGLQLARDLKLSNLRIAGPPLDSYSRSLSFAVRIEDRELLENLDEGLTLVTTTDRYPQLYNAWFGVQEAGISDAVLRRWLLWVSLPLLILILLAVAWSASLRRTVARRTAELKESEERLQGILDNAPMMIYMKAADGRYLLVNRQFEKLVGRQRHQMRGATDSEIFTPPQVAELRARDAQVLTSGKLFRCEEVFPTAGGDRIFLSVRFPLHHADGSVHAVCAISADVTEQKQAERDRQKLEAQMQQTQKLESLGVLAGGIAHDFNNLLMGILGNTGMVRQELEPGSDAHARLSDVESAGRRAAELCKQMLAYSGKGRFVVKPLDLSKLVEEMAHLLRASITKKSEFRQELATNLPAFEADATQIRQVVMNLMTNASEALDDEPGVITLRTGVMECDESYLKQTYLAEELAAGSYVFLEVTDTGSGMDPETRERIFDPFFSTKFVGRGLGLAATLGIVRGHSGALEVDSMPDEGTTFRVLFPASDLPSPTAPARTPDQLPTNGDATILVVDDEDLVRSVARRVLERAGYRVLTAGDGQEGLEVFERHAEDIALVLLDLTMPRMNGDETMREMRRVKHDVRVLLSSGYNEHEATEEITAPELAGYIQKPYVAAALLSKVREAMEVQ